jgi:hypothetical protein
MWQMIGVLAELERSLITERTRAGVNAAKARGTAEVDRDAKWFPNTSTMFAKFESDVINSSHNRTGLHPERLPLQDNCVCKQ